MRFSQETEKEVDLGDLVVFYKQAKQRFDQDPVFKDTARAEVVRLQAGYAYGLGFIPDYLFLHLMYNKKRGLFLKNIFTFLVA